MEIAQQPARGVAVVALISSAGGLDAVSNVLQRLPAEITAALVVQQHLGGRGSALVPILQRRTRLPVKWAEDGTRLCAGTVVVAPPLKRLEVFPDGTCTLHDAADVLRDRPHDALLSSLADSYGAGAVAVVLTGMGKDGASGVQAMRAVGAIVIAQSEDTAEEPSMPRAAAEAGASLVLPLYEIGGVVADVAAGGPLPRPRSEVNAVEALFAGPGRARATLRQIDWSATPLGPVTGWPDALRTVARAVLSTDFPMFLMWGPKLVQIGNDAYAPTLGEKRMQGLPVRATWPELWDFVRPRFEHVLATGQPFFARDAEYAPLRRGFIEEAYFTVCYSALHDGDRIAGVLETSLETTDRVLGDRRTAILRALATSGVGAESVVSACERAMRTLQTNPRDIPFAMVYLIHRVSGTAHLTACTGVEPGSSVAPRTLSAERKDAPWPLDRVVATGTPLFVDDLVSRFPAFDAGPWPESPTAALLLPLRPVTDEPPTGVFVAGFSPRLLIDADYRGFFELVASQIAASLAEAGSRRREHERLERLAELDRLKTDFFSNVSHEFRTPLTLMLGPLDELLDDADQLPPQRRADVELVRRNARRLLRLVGTMLDFSQLEAGRLQARFAPVDLAERTREIVAQFESAVARGGLDLRVQLEEIPEPVWVDLGMWEKIVSNLVANALKFTFTGAIEVTLRALPKHAQLTVRDTGVGIPQEELPHIFKRFHRIHGTRARSYEGAGIGLALVDELVRRHHGRIRATSIVGEGTTFTVWLPLGRRSTTAPPESDEPSPSGVAGAMAEEAMQWGQAAALPRQLVDDVDAPPQLLRNYARGARVLIADDHADMRQYLARLLAPHWTVDVAADGAEALELARRNTPELVLADVMMPRLDGFGLVRALRDDATLRSVPVVLVTARAGEESAIEGLLAGADDYVVKPFSGRELTARVAAQLELAQARRHAAELNEFRIRLSDALRGLDDPLDIEHTACRMVLEQLGADRVRYVELDEQHHEFVTSVEYNAAGMPPALGRYAMAAYAPLRDAIHAGRRLVITDTQTDPEVASIRDALAALHIGAHLVVPLMRDGQSVAAFAVHQHIPRNWTAEEVALAEEAAGRAWAELSRARAESALRTVNVQLEERIRALVQLAGENIWTTDCNGRVVENPPSWCRLTGQPRQPSSGSTWLDAVHPEDHDAISAQWADVVRDRAALDVSFRVRHAASGGWHRIRMRAIPLSGSDGKPREWLAISSDLESRT